MNILIIGSGGREHAIVKGLKESPTAHEIHAVPGSDGIAQLARCHAIDTKDRQKVFALIQEHGIDLVVVGPEQPLVDGLPDFLREKGIAVFGPNSEGAQLEGSKIFSKRFMEAAGVPTARSFEVRSVQEAINAAKNFQSPWVLKADGLAAGKGVTIHDDFEEFLARAEDLFEKGVLGEAGRSALVEEFSPGWELSYLILTNGREWTPMPLAQDHKRLLDGDKGPNTGGMGVVAPLKIDSKLNARIEKEILEPVMREMERRNMLYRGVLYVGLMITDRGPSVLEFNTRFGDPEAQVLIPLLDGDWASVFRDIAEGRLPQAKWHSRFASCLVMAAPGYPDSPKKGVAFRGDVSTSTSDSWFIHAGTKKTGDGWMTNGGRVLNAVGVASTLEEALKKAYAQAAHVTWDGMQLRRDIGAKVLNGL